MNPLNQDDGPKLNKSDLFRSFSLILAAVLCFLLVPSPHTAQDAELLVSPGKLSRVHAELSGINNCTACHTERKKVDPAKCLACHKELAARVKAGRGLHKKWRANCLPCHPEHQGPDFNLIEWDLKKFSHGETGFPLTGLHKKISDCAACHATKNALERKKGQSYLLKGSGCADCHADPHRGQMGTSCSRCHSTNVPFKQAAFDHGKTSFPLNGAHRNLACAVCHTDKKGKDRVSSRCSDCHADPHQPSLGKDCRGCHGENSWKTSRFNHDRTRFPLRGKHGGLACVLCHGRETKSKKIAFANCADCHRQDPHRGRFGKDCQACHVVDGFKKVSFNHDKTLFPLTGKHIAVSCQKCHTKKNPDLTSGFKQLSTACSDCHADVHLGQFAGNCQACHSTRGFSAAELKFNHQTDSIFPLLGKHALVSCQKCHLKARLTFPSGQGEAVLYKPLASDCRSCHGDAHQGQLAGECSQCHGFDSFKPAPGFDHERSRFSLRLFHENVACRACHPLADLTVKGKTVQTVRYKNISSECLECHRNFDHSRTAFALNGVHGGLDCRSCHNARTPNVNRAGKNKKHGTECTLCHRSPHLGQRENCRECHSGKNWRVEPW